MDAKWITTLKDIPKGLLFLKLLGSRGHVYEIGVYIEQAPKIHGKLIFKDKEDSDPKDDVHELIIPGGDEWI